MRILGVTAFALALHVGVLSVIEPPQVDLAALARAGAGADSALDADPNLVEVNDALVDLDCQGAVTLRTLGRLGVCELRGDGDTCRDRAWSRYRIESVGCREPLDTPELAEVTPTPILDADIINIPPLEELIEPPADDSAPEDEPDDKDPDGQVVEIAKPEIEVRPDEADFVAEYDSKVDKQTIKRGRPEDGSPSPPPRERPEVAPDPAPASSASDLSAKPTPPAELAERASERPGREGAPGALSMRGESEDQPASGETYGVEELGPDGLAPRLGRRFAPGGSAGERGVDGDGGTARSLPPRALRPSPEALSKVVAQGSDDYLPGVDEGEGTALNAKRWKHASFFNRVKGQVRQNWNPQRAYRLRDPTGNIYGTKDRLTVVTVSLRPDGTLNNVWIAQPSGVGFLDDEAVNAFRQAQPFPNPPDALVDRDSRLITFRFGFMFQINNRAGWKVFRYK